MNKFLILFLTIFFGGCNTSPEETITENPSSVSKPPNILLIIADDMGVDATPNYNVGNIKPNMPHLETLMSQGITFDNTMAYPVCSPTRAAILTGKYGFRTGILNVESGTSISLEENSIFDQVDNVHADFSHALIGKWHLSNGLEDPNLMGVDYFAGSIKGGLNDYYNWRLVENGATSNQNSYATSLYTDLALNWIKNQTTPWFCWLAYNSPHTPLHLPPTGTHQQAELPTDSNSIDNNPTPYYMSMIENIDHELGRLMEHIDLAETVIIFLGDNGTPRNVIQKPYLKRQSKGTLYQGGIHTPLVVAGKSVQRVGVRENALVHVIDLFATISDLAGNSSAVLNDSKSFVPLLSQSDSNHKEYNYVTFLTENNTSNYAIRNQKYKLIDYGGESQELYDLTVDPYEQNNMLNSSLNAEAMKAKNDLENYAISLNH